jgi:uncharacterized membrane protein YfcA
MSFDGVCSVLEISRILTAAGLVAASVGLVVFGMGAAYAEPRDFEMNLGILLMVAGVIGSIVGILLYRQYSIDD